jgi:glycosyltransferase involved in cell wall biosynthesis
LILFIAVLLSLVGLIIYLRELQQRIATAPLITLVNESIASTLPGISVIIPAYNEAANIHDCVTSVLESTALPASQLEVWVVDDQSSDETLTIVELLQETSGDPRLQILVGQPRPEHEIWMGKNWACSQAAAKAKGDFFLFLDADVRLEPGAIESAIQAIEQHEADLLTLCPAIVCGCFSEWLVQPLLVGMLLVGFDFAAINDPKNETAFAIGQFMLFRRTAYTELGGHGAVADQVVEDVEFARRLKAKGKTMYYALGKEIARVRMYRNWGELWEGWTKNWHLGSRRNLRQTLYSAIATFWVCTIPWLSLAIVVAKSFFLPLSWVDYGTLVITIAVILLQFRFRQLLFQLSALPTRYWWLTGLGGLLASAIALASIIKTETGWGWTWRGRSLKLPNS